MCNQNNPAQSSNGVTTEKPKGLFKRAISSVNLSKRGAGSPLFNRTILKPIDQFHTSDASLMLNFEGNKPLRSCISVPSFSVSISELSECAPKQRKRSVSFSTIHIREYPRTLGTHPAPSSGPSLALDWYVPPLEESDTDASSSSLSSSSSSECSISCKTFEMSVDDYENSRTPRKARPAIIGRNKRERLLKEFGVTSEEMRQMEISYQESKNSTWKVKEEVSFRDSVMGKLTSVVKKNNNSTQVELDELMRRSAVFDRLRKERSLQNPHGNMKRTKNSCLRM